MSFNPTRASPSKPIRNRQQPTLLPPQPSDTSCSSATSAINFASLTPQDVKIIDSIIQRAPPSATSFLAVFKAYNDVLQERGLDASQDVLYYRFLLKLGVLRGTWGERWESLKSGGTSRQNSRTEGYDHDHTTDDTVTELDFSEARQPTTPRPQTARPLPSRSIPIIPRTTSITPGPPPTRGRSFAHPSGPSPSNPTQFRPVNLTPSAHAGTRTIRGSSSSPSGPPSYRTYPPEPLDHPKTPKTPILSAQRWHEQPRLKTEVAIPPPKTLAEFAAAAARAGKLKLPTVPKQTTPGGSAINAEETWKVLRMEAEADDFRHFYLLKKCWDVWHSGLQWYERRGAQVDLARSHVILRHALGVWKSRSTYYVDLGSRAENISHILLKRAVWKRWKVVFFESRRRKWQEDMKRRLSEVRKKSERRLVSNAFTHWRRRHYDTIAILHDKRSLLTRFLHLWRTRLGAVDSIEEIGDKVVETRQRMILENAIDVWKRRTQLQKSQIALRDFRDSRIVRQAWNTWRDNADMSRLARQERKFWILKTAIRKWGKAVERNKTMERRAVHYVHRQEVVLKHAVLRVWVAQERGALLERVRRSRLLALAWAAWKSKMVSVQDLSNRLRIYEARDRNDLMKRALHCWEDRVAQMQAANRLADKHHARQLKIEAIQTWRVRLAANQRQTKSARIAKRWFAERRAWKAWRFALEEKRRQKKLEEFQKKSLKSVFITWRAAAQKQRHNKFLVLAFQEKSDNRILSQILAYWVNRVVEQKSLELQISDDRDSLLIKSAFERWRSVHKRHREEMSLMQSYHDVKRDDLVRRTFLRWLAATRKSVQRQRRLAQREEERRDIMLANAWEQWRDRFKERELGWMERQIRLQMDMNVLFRSFRVWESKTMSVPALRFCSLNQKARAWNKWRDALPRARKEREARELDRKWMLSKALAKWKEAYRSKIQMKAIVRARHLRLPVVPSARPTYRRPSIGTSTSRPFPSTSQSAFARVTAARLPSPERPAMQPANRRPPDEEPEATPEPAPRISRSPVRGERISLLGRGIRTVLPPAENRFPASASAPALSALARSIKNAGSEVDPMSNSEDERAEATSSRSKRPSPRKLGGGYAASASAKSTSGLDRDRLRLELRGGISRRAGL